MTLDPSVGVIRRHLPKLRLGRKMRGFLVGLALAAISLAAGALTLDRIFPPDLSRYNDRSTEVVDANGRLLRAFTTQIGRASCRERVCHNV